MELAGEEPRMILNLHHLDQFTVLRSTADYQSAFDELINVVVVHLVTMPMALVDHILTVYPVRQAALIEDAGLLS